MRIGAEQAAARVRAGLGRPPQDALEATVVLEAWGGLRARAALDLAPAVVARSAAPRRETHLLRPAGEVARVDALEILGLVATLLATTAWVAPLATALGVAATTRAWQIALPLSLALQWMLRRRYLNGAGGLGRLRGDGRFAVPLLCSYPAVAGWLWLDVPTAMPAALVLTWVGGLAIVVRGWGIYYAVTIAAATLSLRLDLGIDVVTNIVAVLLATGVTLLAALLSTPVPETAPTPWRRSVLAALVGGTTALLIVLDPSVEWTSTSPFPVVALVPSLLASVWAGRHLNRIWTVLVGSLAGTRLTDRGSARNRRVFAGIVLGSVGRLLLGTLFLSSVAFLLLRRLAGSDLLLLQLLVGLGAFSVIGFVTATLESFGRARSALVVAGVALLAGLAAGEAVGVQHNTLVVAALAALVAAAAPVAALVGQPDRTLATLL